MPLTTRSTIKGALAAGAAAALLVALPMAPAQADSHTQVPAGTWKLVGLQVGDAPVVPCPTPTSEFSERWFCEENTTLTLRKNGNYRDNIPIIQTNRGTWFSNGKNVIVFDDAGDTGSDARAYGMSLSGKNGQNLKISLKSTGRGPNEETLELHMIFKKQ